MKKPAGKMVITGVSGLIGFHLADRLCRSHPEMEVVGLARSSNPNVLDLGMHCNFRFVAMDILESPNLGDVLEGAQVVYHLAAESAIYRVKKDPLAGLRTNVQGTLRLATEAARAGGPKVVYSSAGAVYESQRYATEERVGQPSSFYGASKLAAESYLQVAGTTLGLRYTILRLARVYGPRMSRGAIYDLIQDFRARRPANMFAHPDSVFDLIHVEDVVAALTMAAGKKWDGVTANIATGEGVRLRELYAAVGDLFGYTVPLAPVEAEPSVDVLLIDRAKSLGWEPRHTLASGLRESWRWALSGQPLSEG